MTCDTASTRLMKLQDCGNDLSETAHSNWTFKCVVSGNRNAVAEN